MIFTSLARNNSQDRNKIKKTHEQIKSFPLYSLDAVIACRQLRRQLLHLCRMADDKPRCRKCRKSERTCGLLVDAHIRAHTLYSTRTNSRTAQNLRHNHERGRQRRRTITRVATNTNLHFAAHFTSERFSLQANETVIIRFSQLLMKQILEK